MTVRMFGCAIATLALAVGATRAQAQERRFFGVGNMGYAWDQPHGGFSINGGIGAGSSKIFGYLLPLDVTFVQGKQDRRYVMQSTIYGDQICQDRTSGEYVSGGNCRAPVSTHWGGAAELNYAPFSKAGSLFAGAGYRTGYASTVYGTVGYIGKATGRTFGLARLSIGSGFALLAIGGHI